MYPGLVIRLVIDYVVNVDIIYLFIIDTRLLTSIVREVIYCGVSFLFAYWIFLGCSFLTVPVYATSP
jgi:hypothetical protein